MRPTKITFSRLNLCDRGRFIKIRYMAPTLYIRCVLVGCKPINIKHESQIMVSSQEGSTTNILKFLPYLSIVNVTHCIWRGISKTPKFTRCQESYTTNQSMKSLSRACSNKLYKGNTSYNYLLRSLLLVALLHMATDVNSEDGADTHMLSRVEGFYRDYLCETLFKSVNCVAFWTYYKLDEVIFIQLQNIFHSVEGLGNNSDIFAMVEEKVARIVKRTPMIRSKATTALDVILCRDDHFAISTSKKLTSLDVLLVVLMGCLQLVKECQVLFN